MMSRNRSIDRFLLATARPKDRVAILLSELINENALGPSIAFAERVYCIDLSQITRRPPREVDSVNGMPFRCQLRSYLLIDSLDEALARREDGLGVGFNS